MSDQAPSNPVLDNLASDIRLKERFVRWQLELRQMLGTHIALVVVLSTGGLGFVGSTFGNQNAKLDGGTAWLLLGAGGLFLLSLCAALYGSCSRVEDVRATVKIL